MRANIEHVTRVLAVLPEEGLRDLALTWSARACRHARDAVACTGQTALAAQLRACSTYSSRDGAERARRRLSRAWPGLVGHTWLSSVTALLSSSDEAVLAARACVASFSAFQAVRGATAAHPRWGAEIAARSAIVAALHAPFREGATGYVLDLDHDDPGSAAAQRRHAEHAERRRQRGEALSLMGEARMFDPR